MRDDYGELFDPTNSESLESDSQNGAHGTSADDPYARLAMEMTRVFVEESPRLAMATQARQLAALRDRAMQARAERRFGFAWVWSRSRATLPRWAAVAAVVVLVVLGANGITVASASSLPGSPLYPVKLLAEQGNVLFAPSSAERARIWMNLAGIRLDEAQRMLANGQRVDPAILDGIDESILQALSEITGTRGAERVSLLEQITQLAMRQQTVLDALAAQSSPADRTRFEQTSRLLNGVAAIAGAAQSNPGLPLSPTATGTVTASATSTSSPEPTDTLTPSPSATDTPKPTLTPPPPTATTAAPTNAPAPAEPSGTKAKPPAGPAPSDTPEPQRGGTPEPQKSETPEPQKSETPEPQQSQSPEPQRSETPEHQQTQTPDN